MSEKSNVVIDVFKILSNAIAQTNNDKGFWSGNDLDYEIPRQLALIHSEVSEALEEHRKSGLTKDFEEELADIIIRTLDIAGHFNFDIGGKVLEKMEKNRLRPHKHGKRY